jgi:hypothetical protein
LQHVTLQHAPWSQDPVGAKQWVELAGHISAALQKRAMLVKVAEVGAPSIPTDFFSVLDGVPQLRGALKALSGPAFSAQSFLQWLFSDDESRVTKSDEQAAKLVHQMVTQCHAWLEQRVDGLITGVNRELQNRVEKLDASLAQLTVDSPQAAVAAHKKAHEAAEGFVKEFRAEVEDAMAWPLVKLGVVRRIAGRAAWAMGLVPVLRSFLDSLSAISAELSRAQAPGDGDGRRGKSLTPLSGSAPL